MIIFSSQPTNDQSKENFPLISSIEINNKGRPVVLVVVKEEAREDMEKLAKKLGVMAPTNFAYYRDYMQESSDDKYVLKDVFISSSLKNIFSGLFSRTLVLA